MPTSKTHISNLKPDPNNARRHTPRGIGTIERSLQRDGFGRSILLANDGTIIAGNATTEAATNAGIENVRIIESDGTEIIAVKRTDIEPGSAEFVSLAIADNRASEHSSFDPEVLQALIAEGKVDADEFWFPEELAEVLETVPDVEFPEYTEDVENDVQMCECPECGHRFPK